KEESYPEVIDEIPQIEYRQIDEVIKQSNADFRIYPNPADELVFIELTGKTDCENFLYVYDITGVRVLATALRNDYKLTWIDTEGFQTGIYFFEVFSNGNTFGAEKVIIE
ncbi:MAG TPA: T9SS type A sorting domain-containing protein, partial [Chitinophagales bacterium]|nr:T9SS type A sorting domain-containing protein [Chitinophagales bacterium]